VRAAGLCARERLALGGMPYSLDEDAGDYRNVAAPFIRARRKQRARKAEAAGGEEAWRAASSQRRVGDRLGAAVRKRALLAMGAQLPWRGVAPDAFLAGFPGMRASPGRFAVQLFLFMFYNYHQRIDHPFIERALGADAGRVNRYLKLSGFGCSYTNLLARIRNAHARELLRVPMLTVGEVGELVGYKSNVHFSVAFKRGEGMTPKEYRERCFM